MSDWFSESMRDYPFFIGSAFLIFGITYFCYKVFIKKESFSMQKHDIFEWKVLVNSWVLIFLLIIIGVGLIFKS